MSLRRSKLLTNPLSLHRHPRLPTRHPLLAIRFSSTSSPPPTKPPPTYTTNPTLIISTPFNPPPTSIPGIEEPFQKRKSGTKAGTILRGLGYIRGKENILAKPDGEYPDWLWGILDNTSSSSSSTSSKSEKVGEGVDGEGDFFSKSKKQRRLAAKAARKAAEAENNEGPKIPLEQQSIDLPVADLTTGTGTTTGGGQGEGKGWKEAQKVREELTSALRRGRRKGIKEANYLKGIK